MEQVVASLIGALVLAIGIVGGSNILHQSQDSNKGRVVAEQMKVLQTAMNQMVLDHYSQFTQTVPVGGSGVPISNTCLVNPSVCFAGASGQGYVPPGYTFRNAYNQTWEAAIAQPTAGTLEVLISSTGGNPIPHKMLPYVASQAGSEGGFIPYATAGVNAGMAGKAIGTGGAWSVPVSQFFTGASTPKGGALASLLYYQSGAQSSDYLYAVQVPGQPQLNQMQTGLTLAMTNNATVGQPCYNQLPSSGSPTYFPLGTLVSTPGGTVLDCINMTPPTVSPSPQYTNPCGNEWQVPMNWNTGVDTYVFGPGSYQTIWTGSIPGYGGWAEQVATAPGFSSVGGGKGYHLCQVQNASQYTWNTVAGGPPYMGYGNEGGVNNNASNLQSFSVNLYPVTNPDPTGRMQWWFYSFGEMQSGYGPMTAPTYSINCF